MVNATTTAKAKTGINRPANVVEEEGLISLLILFFEFLFQFNE
jgi:hypothetical protein